MNRDTPDHNNFLIHYTHHHLSAAFSKHFDHIILLQHRLQVGAHFEWSTGLCLDIIHTNSLSMFNQN
jgi:hypothetical protein